MKEISMFHNMLSTVAGLGQNKLRTLVTSAMLAGLPTAAFARHHDFRFEVPLPIPVPQVILPAAPCDPPPARVWIAPVYQDVTEQVWIPAVTRTEIQCVDVPAQYGYRDVVVRDFFGRRHIRQEQVLISPAHRENQPVEVVVAPGHFEVQTHQQLVCDGHWQDVR
jgi:hypothetical protein